MRLGMELLGGLRGLAAGMVLLVGSGVAQTLSLPNPEYRLVQSDVLEVKFRYTPEFNQVVSIRPDGRVTLEATGSFLAADLTLDEFKARVVALATKRLVEPDVAVTLKEFVKPSVLVEGEVATPGRVELRAHLSALDAIALAGGFKVSAKKTRVLLLRHDANGSGKTSVLDLQKLIAGHHLEEGTQLLAGDVLYVTQDSLSKVERLARMGQFGAIYSPVR